MANTDSMVTIALCYGKQVAVLQDRLNQESALADGYYEDACEDEVILNDVEQPKHLMVYDLGLSERWRRRMAQSAACDGVLAM